MNQPIFLNKYAFNLLLSKLIEIEEGIDEIIADFFYEPSKEAEDVRQLLNEYVRRLDGIIRNITTIDTAGDIFPWVVVGSEVRVENLCSGIIYCYKLISPLKDSVNPDEISLLSPMGKALLFRSINEQFILQAPDDKYEFRVVSVRINPDC